MATPNVLDVFSQSRFPGAVSPELVAGCPTIDLSLTVGDGDVISVRRAGAELVFKQAERNQKVQAVRWKPDGEHTGHAQSHGVSVF